MANTSRATARCTAPHTYSEGVFHVRMTVSSDGSACSFEVAASGFGKSGTGRVFPYKSGTVGTEPEHGTVKLRFLPDQSFADYTPTVGYVGPDHFVLNLQPGTRPWDINVTVVK